MGKGKWVTIAVVVAIIAITKALSNQLGFEKDAAIEWLKQMSDRLAGASLLFGFFPAVLCVFCAKILGASLSFWIGRFVFRSSSSAIGWAQNNKYFHILSRGVERDGWKFVLLARFSPIPSYVINYALAATKVRFFLDFLLPTAIGCLPMILQNTSIGSLAGAAVSSGSGSKASNLRSYIFPLLGILASILISLRVKKYSKDISVAETVPTEDNDNNRLSERQKGKGSKKR
ncbi:uncharacterized protein LOC107808169 isoform X2 [Nicotiana tabacum]|uniref:Uncharacterized protein LOC107808169 isoform X2 n=1 Tax=Nicotiana tabacum TaxID=4097 RepID=A0A1S4BGZ5_TOBAC|nr:PREDICTED: uncharacterized protein LOC107808169 isoform X2 [Nicotiana tabacum]